MPRQRTTGRPLALLRGDTKRNLKDKSSQFLRVYIGRIALRMLVAEHLIEERGDFPALAPSLVGTLRLIEKMALEEEE